MMGTKVSAWQRHLLHALIWGGLAAFLLAFTRANGPLYSGAVLIYVTLGVGLWLGSEGVRALTLRGHWMDRGGWGLTVRVLLAVTAVAAAIQFVIFLLLTTGFAQGWVTLPPGGPKYGIGAAFAYWLNTAFLLGLWVAVWLIGLGFRRARQGELARLRAEAQSRALELEALKARINPHFMFNALNNLRALINEDTERARELVTRLSNTLRYALYHSQQQRVSLAEELAVIDDYLAVEAVHYEERLRVHRSIEPAALEAQLPPMLLQLLIENAIKHGIARTPGGGELSLRAGMEAGRLRMEVGNPGKLDLSRPGPGVGLSYLRTNLAQHWPNARFALESDAGDRVLARLELPQ